MEQTLSSPELSTAVNTRYATGLTLLIFGLMGPLIGLLSLLSYMGSIGGILKTDPGGFIILVPWAYFIGFLPALGAGWAVTRLEREEWWRDALKVMAVAFLISVVTTLCLMPLTNRRFSIDLPFWIGICGPATFICWGVVRWLLWRRKTNQPLPSPSIEAP